MSKLGSYFPVQKKNVCNSGQKLRKRRYQSFLLLANFAWFLHFVPNVLLGIVELWLSVGKWKGTEAGKGETSVIVFYLKKSKQIFCFCGFLFKNLNLLLETSWWLLFAIFGIDRVISLLSINMFGNMVIFEILTSVYSKKLCLSCF